MLADKLHMFLISPIIWGILGFIIVAITLSGKWNLNYANILFIIAFLIGCFEISRIGAVIHLRIIFCLLLGIGLTALSLWITPSHPQSKTEQLNKPPLAFVIADCTFDIIFKITDQYLKILQASKHGIENGTLFANVDIYEKDNRGKFIALAIMGEWNNTEGRIGDSIENLTLFSLSSQSFMFSRKKPTIANAQSGMTHLFSNKKYTIQIHGVTTADSKALILSATSATIQTHEGIVFPTTEFKRLDGSLNEYWQADFPSVPIRN